MVKHTDSNMDISKSVQTRKKRTIRSLFSRNNIERDNAVASSPAQPETEIDIDSNTLCDWCTKVDWEAWTARQAHQTSSAAPAALRVAMLNPTTCPMCYFLSKSLNSSSPKEIYHLIVMRNEPLLDQLLGSVDVSIFGLVPHLYLPGRSILNTQTHLVFELCSQTTDMLMPIMPHIDVVRIGSWLRMCLDWHTNRCCPSGLPTCDLRVIDCSSRTIIAHPVGAAYVTLSYVWGPANIDDCEVPPDQPVPDRSTLPLCPPQTIEDAIKVTLGLGYQYLWVDK
jgi:hypothetical protein